MCLNTTVADLFKCLLKAILNSFQDRLPGFPEELDFLTDLTQMEAWARNLDVTQLESNRQGAPGIVFWLCFQAFWCERDGETAFLLSFTEWMREQAQELGLSNFLVKREVACVQRNLDRPESAMRDRSGMWLIDYQQNAYEAACRLATYLAEQTPDFWIKAALWIANYASSYPTFAIMLQARHPE